MNSLRTRIKFCGITSVDDAQAAVAAGADAIGLVFHPASSRHITATLAAEIADSVPAFVVVTGLFVDCDARDVSGVLRTVRIDLLQFHGDESPEYCGSFNKPYMKAFRVKAGDDITGRCAAYCNAAALLLDAWHPEHAGGSGTVFDWTILDALPHTLRERLVLAGGLTPENAESAVITVRPYAVDVSTGIESAPGRKCVKSMRAFSAAVRCADDRRQ